MEERIGDCRAPDTQQPIIASFCSLCFSFTGLKLAALATGRCPAQLPGSSDGAPVWQSNSTDDLRGGRGESEGC